jgi:Rrf2 family iron-sulfur cluster assembly transcriptional regulator
MRLSTKGRFAVTAMIDVALREKLGPVSLSDISARHQISLSYLEQMFSKLRQQGLVSSIRGPGGGYTFCRTAQAISVANIISAVEDDSPKAISPSALTTDLAQDLWDSVSNKLAELMQAVTLDSLVQEQLAKGLKIESKPAPNRGVFKKPTYPIFRPNVPNSVFALGQNYSIRG